MKKLFFLIICLSLVGCAQIKESICQADAAYAQGVNDAKDNKNMDDNYAMICSAEQRASLNSAYRQGYQFALRHQPVRININTK